MSVGQLAGPIGVFGGTFDPIHFGHLRSAFELLQSLQLREVRFLPCGNPPHRAAPIASASLRVAMVECAIASQEGFVLDDREVRRPGLSYSVDTLRSLRGDFPQNPLCLIVGMDSFLSLPKWYQWQEILQLAHIVVAHRPGWRAPERGALGRLLTDRGTSLVADLHKALAGAIYVQEVTQLEISSTSIRALIAAGHDPRFLLPQCVREQVQAAKCYSDETGVREQLVESTSPLIAGSKQLVPDLEHNIAAIVAALEDGKAQDIKVIDVRGHTSMTDFMVIASGTSDRHVRSVAGNLVTEMKKAGERPLGIEGESDGEWVLVDLQDALVHVMLPRVRDFYNLEKLWDLPARAAAKDSDS